MFLFIYKDGLAVIYVANNRSNLPPLVSSRWHSTIFSYIQSINCNEPSLSLSLERESNTILCLFLYLDQQEPPPLELNSTSKNHRQTYNTWNKMVHRYSAKCKQLMINATAITNRIKSGVRGIRAGEGDEEE